MASSVPSAPGAGPPEWEYLPIGGMHDQICVGELAEMGRGLVELSTTSDTPVRVIFSPVDALTRGQLLGFPINNLKSEQIIELSQSICCKTFEHRSEKNSYR